MTRTHLPNILYGASGLLLLAGLLAHLSLSHACAPFLLAAGSIGYIVSVLLSQRSKEQDLRGKRLHHMALFSGLLWLASSIALWLKSGTGYAFLIGAIILMCYSNIALAFRKSTPKP